MEYAFIMFRDVHSCKLFDGAECQVCWLGFNTAKMCLGTHYQSSVSASRWRNRHASTRVDINSPRCGDNLCVLVSVRGSVCRSGKSFTPESLYKNPSSHDWEDFVSVRMRSTCRCRMIGKTVCLRRTSADKHCHPLWSASRLGDSGRRAYCVGIWLWVISHLANCTIRVETESYRFQDSGRCEGESRSSKYGTLTGR